MSKNFAFHLDEERAANSHFTRPAGKAIDHAVLPYFLIIGCKISYSEKPAGALLWLHVRGTHTKQYSGSFAHLEYDNIP